MNKKGILFTITTILLLGSMIFIVSNYVKKSDRVKYVIQESYTADRLRYIENDVASDFLDLINVTLMNITKNNNEVVLRFSNFGKIPRVALKSNLSEYEQFLEDNYSKLINTEIKLTNFNQNMTFRGYNSTFVLYEGGKDVNLDVFTQDYSNIKNINLTLEINVNISNSFCPSNDAPGNPQVHLIVCYNGQKKLDCIRRLKTSGTCASQGFYVKPQGIEPNERVDVEFCEYNNDQGTLRVNSSSGLTAEITNLRYTYNAINRQTWLETSESNLYLNPRFGNLVKNNSILLGEESYYKYTASNQGCRKAGLTCAGFCQSLGYEDGTCRENVQQCIINDETNEAGGNQYCTEGPSSDTCCCDAD